MVDESFMSCKGETSLKEEVKVADNSKLWNPAFSLSAKPVSVLDFGKKSGDSDQKSNDTTQIEGTLNLIISGGSDAMNEFGSQ